MQIPDSKGIQSVDGRNIAIYKGTTKMGKATPCSQRCTQRVCTPAPPISMLWFPSCDQLAIFPLFERPRGFDFSCVQLAIFPLFARPRGLDNNACQVNIEIGGAGVLRYAYTATACALTCDISSVNSSILSGLALMLLQERSDDVAMATAMAMAMDWPWPPP